MPSHFSDFMRPAFGLRTRSPARRWPSIRGVAAGAGAGPPDGHGGGGQRPVAGPAMARRAQEARVIVAETVELGTPRRASTAPLGTRHRSSTTSSWLLATRPASSPQTTRVPSSSGTIGWPCITDRRGSLPVSSPRAVEVVSTSWPWRRHRPSGGARAAEASRGDYGRARLRDRSSMSPADARCPGSTGQPFPGERLCDRAGGDRARLSDDPRRSSCSRVHRRAERRGSSTTRWGPLDRGAALIAVIDRAVRVQHDGGEDGGTHRRQDAGSRPGAASARSARLAAWSDRDRRRSRGAPRA
jgi:hypothetical protein